MFFLLIYVSFSRRLEPYYLDKDCIWSNRLWYLHILLLKAQPLWGLKPWCIKSSLNMIRGLSTPLRNFLILVRLFLGPSSTSLHISSEFMLRSMYLSIFLSIFHVIVGKSISFCTWMKSKSLWRSPAVGDFYGTGIEIWAGFGPNGQLSCLHSFKIFWPMKPS